MQHMLSSVFAQEVEFKFEVIIVDSTSREADVELMQSFPIRLHQIAPAEFRHGRTRNLLASIAQGTVLLYLSQDAVPTGPDWMRTLVKPFDDTLVAGCYARQI